MTNEDRREYDPDLIPDVGETDWPDLVGYIKSTLGIRSAYTTFVPKSSGVGGPISGGRETRIRCPKPDHVDKNPSAWMTETEDPQLWYCGGCQQGGDVIDLVAAALGHPLPGYKRDAHTFADVVHRMADRLGITGDDARERGFTKKTRPKEAASGLPEWPEDFTEDELAEAQSCFESWDAIGMPDAKAVAVRDVVARRGLRERAAEIAGGPPEPELDPGVDHEIEADLADLPRPITAEVATGYHDGVAKGLIHELPLDPAFPYVPWSEVLPYESGLHRCLRATCVTAAPDEYSVWSLYSGFGALVGRRVELASTLGLVDPALWAIIAGPTGTHKSQIAGQVGGVLRKVVPEKTGAGVRTLPLPTSGEKLLEALRREDMISTSGTALDTEVIEHTNCSNYLYVDEFAHISVLLSRSGNTLSTSLLQLHGIPRDRVLFPSEALSRSAMPVTGPMLSILSTTQPNRIMQLMDQWDVASGFMNRFIFGMGKPRRQVEYQSGVSPDWQVVEDEFQLFDDRLNCVGDYASYTDKATIDHPWRLDHTEDALRTLREWLHAQDKKLKSDDDYEAEMLARHEIIMLKLILIMAINRICAEGGPKVWTEADVVAAAAHYDNVAHGWLTAGDRIMDSQTSELEEWLRVRVKRDGLLKRRDLQRLIPKRLQVPAADLNTVITALDKNGDLNQREVKATNGRMVQYLESYDYRPPDPLSEG